ncbi:MAG: hypothetical protein CMJ79_07455 [Planctomycetaceae bacterium]|jgi:hydroxymethylpyrimidine pyrophosphatase-like HAD family hydrolase|nr:hypothetical protein [Planctomycetaceae bacterium]|tara:strand:- start:11013 stop:11750 length:738 start_codon:yes stop_codon:yes gene_type:complete
MYDLIISDIDGCLSPEDSSPLNVEKLSRIADHNRLAFAKNDRPKLTLCTGRPIPFAEGLCRLLQNSGIPCVAENGVWLYDPSCNGYLMDPSITDQQLEMVHEAELFSLKNYRQEGLTLQPGKSASVTLYHPDPAVLQRIAPQLQDEFDRNGFEFRVSLTLFYINCDLPQITKASGIDRLLERTGVDASRTAGIGDTSSDLAIADRVQTFGCPANAIESVKAVADYVSQHEQIDGVLDFMNYLMEQ